MSRLSAVLGSCRAPAVAGAWLCGAVALNLCSGPGFADDAPVGAGIFAGRCAVCHGKDAAGIPGAFPPLHEQIAAFAGTAPGRDYLVMVVSNGLMGELKVAGVSYRGVMPAQSGLSEAEVAAVLSYLASGRGQNPAAPTLSAADVVAARTRHPEKSAQSTHALRPPFPDS